MYVKMEDSEGTINNILLHYAPKSIPAPEFELCEYHNCYLVLRSIVQEKSPFIYTSGVSFYLIQFNHVDLKQINE